MPPPHTPGCPVGRKSAPSPGGAPEDWAQFTGTREEPPRAGVILPILRNPLAARLSSESLYHFASTLCFVVGMFHLPWDTTTFLRAGATRESVISKTRFCCKNIVLSDDLHWRKSPWYDEDSQVVKRSSRQRTEASCQACMSWHQNRQPWLNLQMPTATPPCLPPQNLDRYLMRHLEPELPW